MKQLKNILTIAVKEIVWEKFRAMYTERQFVVMLILLIDVWKRQHIKSTYGSGPGPEPSNFADAVVESIAGTEGLDK
jgi:hypothetical protein